MVVFLDLLRVFNKTIEEYVQNHQLNVRSSTLISKDLYEILYFEGYHYLIEEVPRHNIIIPITTTASSAYFKYDQTAFARVYPHFVQISSGLIVSKEIATLAGITLTNPYHPKVELKIRTF